MDKRKNQDILISTKTLALAQLKKCGPVSKGYEDTHVTMPPDLFQWAKEQPEELAGLVRYFLA